MNDHVPETAIDYTEVFRRGGRNLGDEDFALFKCPNCGHIYLIDYEVDTVYLNADDLAQRTSLAANEDFACVCCGVSLPVNEPWIGPKAQDKFAVSWSELQASRWSWVASRAIGV